MQNARYRLVSPQLFLRLGPPSVSAIRPLSALTTVCRQLAARGPRAGIAIVFTVSVYCSGAWAAGASPMPAAGTDPYAAFTSEASQRFGLPVSWLRAVMQVESGRNPRAVSPKGAMGLMQLMPDTWSALRVQYHLGNDPFDPHDNIVGGTAYLRALFDRFGAAGFLAAYNAGPKRFEDYLAGLRPLRDETKRYLSTLGRMLPELHIGGTPAATMVAANWQTSTLFAGPMRTPVQPNTMPNEAPPGSTPQASNFALRPRSDGLFVPVRMSHPW